ncbi:hypothetical protein Lgee_1716 [Legionella geestiana]|uniref:Uncharacterized protein n=1 Tax=Legionella geestiana TaxID=45065 RepID=A0A0W0TP73_9GAMM|nr:hypothetical protein [Legionella geestiana]KTC97395.1 hypothetical protein Lgee_1716 [Legionella geestiana]STX53933.1 Uncharacterised protein [Legionella geestiana]
MSAGRIDEVEQDGEVVESLVIESADVSLSTKLERRRRIEDMMDLKRFKEEEVWEI